MRELKEIKRNLQMENREFVEEIGKLQEVIRILEEKINMLKI